MLFVLYTFQSISRLLFFNLGCLIHSNLLTLGKLLVKELPGFIEAMPDHAMKKGSRDASDVTYERKLFGELYNLMLFRVILCPNRLIDFDQTWYKCSIDTKDPTFESCKSGWNPKIGVLEWYVKNISTKFGQYPSNSVYTIIRQINIG
uniref:Uncharacterized protein n=1 Tax=Cacopsylla melanoneura TaxID=428564 RepID=A0A8D8LZ25_9HEMI